MAKTFTQEKMENILTHLSKNYYTTFNLEDYKEINVEERRWMFHKLVVSKFIEECLPEHREIIKEFALKIK